MSAATSIVRRCLFRVVSAGSSYSVADDITSSTPFDDLELDEDSVREFVDAASEELEGHDFESLRDRESIMEFLLDGNIDKCVSEACAFFIAEEIMPCKKPASLQTQIVETKAPEPPQEISQPNSETSETSETVMAKKSAHNPLPAAFTGLRITTSDGRVFPLSEAAAAEEHEKSLVALAAAAAAEARLPELKATLGVRPRDNSQDEILTHILRNSDKMAVFFGASAPAAAASTPEAPAPKKRGPKPKPAASATPEASAPKKRGPKPRLTTASSPLQLVTGIPASSPAAPTKRRGRPPGSGKASTPVK